MYPNPAAERVVVKGLVPGMMLEMYDMTGRRVMQGTKPVLDLTALPAGVYLLRCGAMTARVVKE